MDLLKRSLAPITDAAWGAIQKEAARSLAAQLSGRKVVDVVGPKGIGHPAVGLGHLEVGSSEPSENGTRYGIHKVLPLVEVRASFEMNIWGLDDIERGAKDVDYQPVVKAAKNIAAFEEKAIYNGFRPAGIVGMAEYPDTPLTLGTEASRYLDVIVQGLLKLKDREVEGPYALVLGQKPFQILQGTSLTYPPEKQVEKIIGGPVIYSPFINDGFLLSTRGGDLELTLGQDFSIGYETHDTKVVRLYLSESFTFRVLEPRVIVRFRMEEKPYDQ